MQEFGLQVNVNDPMAKSKNVKCDYGFSLISKPKKQYYDVVALAVAHDCFMEMGSEKIKMLGKKNHLFFDLKSVFEPHESDFRL